MDGAARDAALPQMLQHLGPHLPVPGIVRGDQLGIVLQVEGVVAEHGVRERRSEGEKVKGSESESDLDIVIVNHFAREILGLTDRS